MKQIDNCPLKPYNTFGIEAKAKQFVIAENEEDVVTFFSHNHISPIVFIGEGSNILFLNDFDGVLLHYAAKGIALEHQNDETFFVRASAGEHWDDLVAWCVENGFGGLENLSWIPGSVGSSPVQNIGAFGAEAGEFISSVRLYDITDKKFKDIPHSECQFGYRSSVFKKEGKSRYFICSVLFGLPKKHKPRLHYGKIGEALSAKGMHEPSIKQIRDIIIEIRKEKLPDHTVIGNAGSFFKNPLVDPAQFQKLKVQFPDIVHFDNPNGDIKLAAAWLIEQSGWKGIRQGDAGVHAKQALVLVNYGNASGKEIFELAMTIQKSVMDKFGVKLEPEVNIIA